MATCKEIPLPPTPPPARYSLDLTENEACILLQLLRDHTAGSGALPLSSISSALLKAGVEKAKMKIRHRNWGVEDSVLIVEAA